MNGFLKCGKLNTMEPPTAPNILQVQTPEETICALRLIDPAPL